MKNNGALITIMRNQADLSSLHKPEINGRKKSKLIPHNRGDLINSNNWSLMRVCNSEVETKTIMLIESAVRERNKAASMASIVAKSSCFLQGSICKIFVSRYILILMPARYRANNNSLNGLATTLTTTAAKRSKSIGP